MLIILLIFVYQSVPLLLTFTEITSHANVYTAVPAEPSLILFPEDVLLLAQIPITAKTLVADAFRPAPGENLLIYYCTYVLQNVQWTPSTMEIQITSFV